MSNTENSYNYLLKNIEGFIKRHYLNLCFRGLIYFFSLSLFLLILFSLTAYFTWPGTITRSIIFGLTLLLLSSFSIQFVIKPLFAWLNVGRAMDLRHASQLIGLHFPDVSDKLLNTIELESIRNKSNDLSETDFSLVIAGIQQKSTSLNKLDFSGAVNFRENRRYLRFIFLPLLLLLLLFILLPGVVTEGASRIIHFSRTYTQPAPFKFILNSSQTFEEDKPIIIDLQIEGKQRPSEVQLIEGSNSYYMKPVGKSKFLYTLPGSRFNRSIKFYAAGFNSDAFGLTVLHQAKISNFRLKLIYPLYTGIKPELIKTTGEFKVPLGTLASWEIEGINTNSIQVDQANVKTVLKQDNSHGYRFNTRVIKDNEIALIPGNSGKVASDTLRFKFNVTPDNLPLIVVTFDSLSNLKPQILDKLRTFTIKIDDDYGFSSLRVISQYTDNEAAAFKATATNLHFIKGLRSQKTDYSLNPADLLKKAGSKLSVWFEVRDNNEFPGPGIAKSVPFTFIFPDLIKQQQALADEKKAQSEKFSEIGKQASKISSEARALSEKLANSPSLNFEDKTQAENLIQREDRLQKELNEIPEVNLKNQKKILPEESKIINQTELSKRIQELSDPDIRKLLDQLKQMLAEDNKNSVREGLQKLQETNHNRAQELSRLNDLYKKEIQSRQKELIKKELEKLADQENDQSKKSENGEKIKEQERISSDFEKALSKEKDLAKEEGQKALQEIEKDKIEKTRNSLLHASNNLKKKDQSHAQKDQEKAAAEMKDLAKKMEENDNQEQGEEIQQDLSSIRMILENLLRVSFSQESIMTHLSALDPTDPSFRDLVRKEYNLKDNLLLIQDSVSALAKKIPQIQGFVNKEFNSINQNMKTVVQLLSDHHGFEAAGREQFVMTAVNNLAVLLSNTENQMQKSMQNASGKGKKKKGSSGMAKLMEMQQRLNGDMEKSSSGKLQNGEGAETFAKMAAQQEAIRRELQSLLSNQSPLTKKAGNEAGKIMEQTEKDLLYKKPFNTISEHQKQIMTRMLEAENAQKQQEEDNTRVAKSANDSLINISPAKLEKSSIIKQSNSFGQRYIPIPGINSYYKTKINSYFDHLNEGR